MNPYLCNNDSILILPGISTGDRMVKSISLESEMSGSNHSLTSYKLYDLCHLSEPHFPIFNMGIITGDILCVHILHGCHE